MPTLTMYQVDAFAERAFQGNPAAVLLLEEWLSEQVMQAIANENNLAETAFVRRNGKGWDLRWFTPVHEVDFCGHATLAAAHVLATEYNGQGEMAFATRVGELRVSRREGAYQLDLPCFPPQPIEEELNSALQGILPVGCELPQFREPVCRACRRDNRAILRSRSAQDRNLSSSRPGHYRAWANPGFRLALFRARSRHSRGSGNRLHSCDAGAVLG